MTGPLACPLLDLLVRIALAQRDPADRDAMLEILRKDGWLPAGEEAA